MEKVWEVAPRKFDDLIDQLLFNRGIIDDEEKEAFFHPEFEKHLHDPFLMKGVEKAVERIQAAKDNGEIVGIYADYDADGIPGAALFYKALKKIEIKPVVYIPNRETGYGLSKEGIDYLVEKKCSLIVTIDLGIRNINEAIYCKEIGVDLIITDHHLPGDELPGADIVINPKQEGDEYPFKELCGCAVAYKLVSGLSKIYPNEIDEKFLKWNLDLVAISSICDMVPLIGENRLLAKYGLMVIKKTKNLGISKLIAKSGLEPANISAYAVGFQIGPRINAPGRMDHATKSFELLVTEDEDEASKLAQWLDEKNEERQQAMEKARQEAIAQIEKNKLDQNKIIVVAGEWQKGVIGPTASKIVEKYGRPAILFSIGETHLTGSARSVSGVNIVSLFEKAAELIYKFGGHKGAAGITVEKEKYDEFIHLIVNIADKDITDNDLAKVIKIDSKVSMAELTKKMYEKLLLFEPFGMENTKPTFVLESVTLSYPRFVGKEANHLSLLSCQGNDKMKSIYFNFPYPKDMVKSNQSYDLAFNLSLNEWQGESKLDLNIIDLKAHD